MPQRGQDKRPKGVEGEGNGLIHFRNDISSDLGEPWKLIFWCQKMRISADFGIPEDYVVCIRVVEVGVHTA